MASSLADINQSYTGKVRVPNPLPNAVSIKQDVAIGCAVPTESKPMTAVSEEDASEVAICATVRRIKHFTEGTSPSILDDMAMKAGVMHT